MAMFGKDGRQTEARPISANDTILSIIAAGTRVVGDWEGPGLIKVDGRIEGSISGARQIIVGRDGSVHGNVQATEVILAGTVDGSLAATERAELQGTATITGDVQTRVIVVHEGARINGTVRMALVATETVERQSVQVMR